MNFANLYSAFRRTVAEASRQHKNSGEAHGPKALYVADTSALIDGRIAGVADAGFLTGTLLVPTMVLDEIQGLADSADSSRRVRARRGLDMIRRLKENNQLSVETIDEPRSRKKPVDRQLLELAKRRGAALITTDFNLSKVAAIEGVKVLNVNELAGAVRLPLAVGEPLEIAIQGPGTASGQGVGYLEDGTMVVVEGARGSVGKTVQTRVASVLQTAAGKMVFARVEA